MSATSGDLVQTPAGPQRRGMLVASSGGHLLQLRHLAAGLPDADLVAFDTPDAQHLLAGRDVITHRPTNRNARNLVRNLARRAMCDRRSSSPPAPPFRSSGWPRRCAGAPRTCSGQLYIAPWRTDCSSSGRPPPRTSGARSTWAQFLSRQDAPPPVSGATSTSRRSGSRPTRRSRCAGPDAHPQHQHLGRSTPRVEHAANADRPRVRLRGVGYVAPPQERMMPLFVKIFDKAVRQVSD